jgi:hypothetical protein
MNENEDLKIQEFKKKEHEESEKFMRNFYDAIIIALILSLIFLSLVIIFRWGI